MPRQLRVFLCYASQDKSTVQKLYSDLGSEGWIEPWLDKAKILPGQDWEMVIEKAVEDSDVVIVCLSEQSVNKEGFVQREIRYAYNFALEKPDGVIFLIPLRLDNCNVPRKLKSLQWVDYFGDKKDASHTELLQALKLRYDQKNDLDISIQPPNLKEKELSNFIKVQHDPLSKIGTFYIGKYPVTNAQYERFLVSESYYDMEYWKKFPKIKNGLEKGNWDEESLPWLRDKTKYHPYELKDRLPKYWNNPSLGKLKPDNPVVGITWLEANAYCLWLEDNWNRLPEGRENPKINPNQIRLPTREEWVIAAGGSQPRGRFPWDRRKAQTLTDWDRLGELPIIFRAFQKISKRFKSYWESKVNNIKMHANTYESKLGGTSSVMDYPLGESPFGVHDMSGNVWEWQADYVDGRFLLSGGAWNESLFYARVGYSYDKYNFSFRFSRENIGFRILIK